MKLSQRGSLRKKKRYFCTSCLYSNFASNYLPILGYRQMRGTAENEEETYTRNIIWTDDNSLRSLYRWNTRAWRPGFRSLIQLNRFARNGLRSISTAGPREGEGAKGRYHTVATVFFTSRKRASKLRPGPRLTGNGSLRVRSGRVSSSLLFSIYIYSFERGMDFNFKTKRMANE